MKINKKIAASSIAALMAISPVISLAQNTTKTVQAAADSNQKTLLLKHNSYVYGSNGKRLNNYQGSKKLVLTKGATLNYLGGTTELNKVGKYYYYIGRNGYIKAANATPVDNQAQTGTLHLNYNTYVYDKNGKRLKSYKGSKKNTFLRWGHTVKYTATPEAITNDSKQYYYLNDDNYSQNWLPYQTINGNQYYSIGNGGYIKAANVDQIDGKAVYTNEATVTTKRPGHYTKATKNQVPVGSDLSTVKGTYLKVGQQVKVDRVTSMTVGNSADIYYRIKGTTDEFIDSKNITSQPRQPLKIYTKNSYVTFVNNAKAYDINGELQPLKNAVTTYRNGGNAPVYKELYIWVPSENKAELFYETADPEFYGYQGYANYVKVSDVKYLSGPRITEPENTPEEAEADAKTASSTDKQALRKLIDQESTVKASGDTYTGTNKEIYTSNLGIYNAVLRVAKSINSSNKSTVAEVKQASQMLNEAQQDVMNLEKHDNTMPPSSNYLF